MIFRKLVGDKIIKTLNSRKATGPGWILIIIIKTVADVIDTHVTNINNDLQNNIFFKKLLL